MDHSEVGPSEPETLVVRSDAWQTYGYRACLVAIPSAPAQTMIAVLHDLPSSVCWVG